MFVMIKTSQQSFLTARRTARILQATVEWTLELVVDVFQGVDDALLRLHRWNPRGIIHITCMSVIYR